MYPNFWEHAPSISWPRYLWREVTGSATQPSILPESPQIPSTPVPSTTSYSVNPMTVSNVAEYCSFLETHFYPQSLTIRLKIPAPIFTTHLQNKSWIGVEVREKPSGRIIGCAVSKAAGYMESTPIGIIDYLCIEPVWRKKGLFYVLLRTVYAYAVQAEGRGPHIFKKEGGLSLIPPLSMDFIIGRPIGSIHARAPAVVDVVPLGAKHWSDLIKAHKSRGTDILVFTKHNINYETELSVASYNGFHVIFKPTWEYKVGEKLGRAIVVGWYAEDSTIHEGEQDNDIGQDYETIINHLPFDYMYAPSKFPHMTKVGHWSKEGTIGVYAVLIDPGKPFRRAVFSAVSA